MQNDNKISFTKVNHDVNGNPRYVTHFLNLLDAEYAMPGRFGDALYNAHKIGGAKYRAKWYGGGIVFSTYSLDALVREINEATGRNYSGYICN